MSRFDPFTADVLELLAPIGSIRARKMFGGVGIYSAEFFFALVADGELYLKVDERSREIQRRAGAHAFRPFADKPDMNGYWSVPVDVIEAPAKLVEWASRAVAVARAASMSKKRAKRPAK